MSPVLRADRVARTLGDTPALKSATLALEAGRLTALLGPSGAGKSTLLRVLAGLEPVEAGEVTGPDGAVLSRPGRRTPPERRGVGVVFQDYALFPHLTALENVAFGLDALPKAERRARAEALLQTAALGDKLDAYPHELSGGEQQRVALARALAPRPAAILMDEPFSNLDSELRRALRERTLAILRPTGAAVLVVTHDAEEAMTIADTLALMIDGEVVQTGSPSEVYLEPVSLAAARLTGDANSWTGRVAGGALETPFGPVAAPAELEGRDGVAVVRPDGVRLAPGSQARVLASRPAGAAALVTIAPAEGDAPVWRVRAPIVGAPKAGDAVAVTLAPELARVTAR